MLAPDIELVDIDANHWGHWFALLLPPRLRGNRRWGAVILDRDVPVHAVVCTPLATVDPVRAVDPAELRFTGTAAPALAALATALAVDAVVVIDRSVLERVYRDIESSLHRDQDLVAQALVFLRVFKRYHRHGVWTHPPVLEVVPPIGYTALQRTFERLVPDDTSMVAYVIEDDCSDVHASLIAVKHRGHIDMVATHQGIDDALSGPTLARNWRRSYRHLLDLVARRYAPASMAVFLERATCYRIATGPTDQLARDLNRRDVIIDPIPTWMLGLLGGATMAAFAGRGAKALARMLPSQARKMAAGLVQSAQNSMRESGAHPFDLLGFDPIEFWLEFRRLYE